MGVAPSGPMKANSRVRGCVCARQKAPEGMTDRQTDRHVHMIHPLYDDLFNMFFHFYGLVLDLHFFE